MTTELKRPKLKYKKGYEYSLNLKTPVGSQTPKTSPLKSDTLSKQIDGHHYKEMGLQPWEIIEKNNLDYFHGAALKYLLRWKTKDGVIDLDKIIHYVEHIKALALEGHYGEEFIPLKKQLTKLREGWADTLNKSLNELITDEYQLPVDYKDIYKVPRRPLKKAAKARSPKKKG